MLTQIYFEINSDLITLCGLCEDYCVELQISHNNQRGFFQGAVTAFESTLKGSRQQGSSLEFVDAQYLFIPPPHYYIYEHMLVSTIIHLTIRRAWQDVCGAGVSSAAACWDSSGVRRGGGRRRCPAGHVGNALLLQLFEVKFNNLFSLWRERERQIESDTQVEQANIGFKYTNTWKPILTRKPATTSALQQNRSW